MPHRSRRAVVILAAAALAVTPAPGAAESLPRAPVAAELHGALTPSFPAAGGAVTFGGVFSLCVEGEWQFREESWDRGVHSAQTKDRYLMLMARLNVLPTRDVSPFLNIGVAWDHYRWDTGVTPPPPYWGDSPSLREREGGSGTSSGPLIGVGADIRVVPQLVGFVELRAALLLSGGDLTFGAPGGLRLGFRVRLPR